MGEAYPKGGLMDNWYVMQVFSGREEKVARSCRDIVDPAVLSDCFIPYIVRKKKYQGAWHDVEEILFKGYVFLISDDVDTLFQELKKVPEITKILGKKNSFIYPLEEREVVFLKDFTKDNHKVEMSYGFIVNDRVNITDGPLMGKEGLIRKIDRHKRKAVIEISFLQQTVYAEVGLEIISKTSNINVVK